MRSKDFSEKEAKARKQGFQAKIWMQKPSVRGQFFSNQFQIKFKIFEERQKSKQVEKNENEKEGRKLNKKVKKKGAININSQTKLSLGDTSEIKRL